MFSKLFSEGNILIKTIKQKTNAESSVIGRKVVYSETNMPFKTHIENNWELTSRIFLVYAVFISWWVWATGYFDLQPSIRITCLHGIV